MNRKGNSDLAIFVIVLIGLLLLAPIMLKIVNEILDPFSASLNSSSPTASATVDTIQSTFTTFWDYLIIIAMLANIVMLFLFSFLADTHPFFLVLYIIFVVVLISFAPYAVEPAKQIFGMSEFSTEIAQLPLTNFVINGFNLILLGIIVVTGIILYAKFRGRSSDL